MVARSCPLAIVLGAAKTTTQPLGVGGRNAETLRFPI